jgi:hypothetical protein
MTFNTKYIFPGDNKNQILEKVNYNFSQLFFNGTGFKGPIGVVGATGIIGQVGRDGDIGLTGDRASNWYFTSVEPASSISQIDDIWINIGPTGAQDVFLYSGTDWVYSGETLLGSSVFGFLPEITGPGGSITNNAIDISNPTPSDVTFVLSDSVGTTSNINPNLAKVLIATDASVNNFPILGFDKTFVGSASVPSFQWEGSGTGYGFVFSSPSDLTFSSGLTSSYSSTGSSSTFSAQTSVSVTSNTTISFTNATGASAAMSFSTPNVINFTGNNVEITPSSATFRNLTQSSGISASAGTLAAVSNSGNGVLVEISGSSATGPAIVTFVNTQGYNIFETRGNNFNVIGQSGPTGSSSGNLVKGSQGVTPSASSTFVRSGFTNNVVPITLTSSTSDIIYITPFYGGTPSADGKANRVYLQISGFSDIWDSATQDGRIFDVFMTDSTLCFGGIRSVFTGGSQSVQIGDFNNSATGGCRHIRFQTVSSSNMYYNASTPVLTSPSRCGYIAISGAVTESGTVGGPSI